MCHSTEKWTKQLQLSRQTTQFQMQLPVCHTHCVSSLFVFSNVIYIFNTIILFHTTDKTKTGKQMPWEKRSWQHHPLCRRLKHAPSIRGADVSKAPVSWGWTGFVLIGHFYSFRMLFFFCILTFENCFMVSPTLSVFQTAFSRAKFRLDSDRGEETLPAV